MKSNIISLRAIVPAVVVLLMLLATAAEAQLGSRVVVGYFHNWNNASAPYIRLRDVNPKYNVVNIAFATPVSHSDMTMTFEPTQQSKSEFISDIRALQASGRRVQISIGGADAPVELKTQSDRDKFVSSMKNIIDEYGFDGYDIDLEGTSVILDNGDNNFKSPTTPKINYLISASRELVNYYRGQGKDFWLTSAPETQYVQGGYGNYGTAFGGYLPVLYALRDLLTFVHVQYYNTGSQIALDERVYSQGTADFIVAMTDMLLRGFPVARNTSNIFPALREDQVAFGLPATGTGAAPAGGYAPPSEVNKALNYLVKGISYGSPYVLPKSYPGLRGIMTWSVNWDKTSADAWVNNSYAFFSTLGGNNFPSVSISSPANNATFNTGANITIAATASDSDGSVTKVDFYQGNTLLGTDTSSPYSFTWSNVQAGSYALTARATDNQNAVSTSSSVNITVGNSNTPPVVSISSPSSGASFSAPATISINANATDNGGVSKVDFFNGSTLLGTDTSSPYSFSWSNVGAGTYSITARATDNENLAATSSAVTITVSNASTQSPYGGTVRTIPGQIEAEHYDLGGEGVAYHDLTTGNSGNAFRSDNVDLESTTDGGGYNVGWIQAGEWLEYTVSISTAGSYQIAARVAAISSGKTFHIELDGVNVSATLTVPNTGGWQNWQTVSATTPSLTAGQKVMRIFADQGDFNVNYVQFTSSGNTPPLTAITSPQNGASFNAPASITITATASDNVSVSKVDFYNGSTLLGTDTSSPYSFTWNSVSQGTYTLTTRATDNQGAVGTSSPVSITVNGGSGGCSGKPQYVENGGYVAGSEVQNAGSWYECKPYPYTGWCNGASWAYAPGTGAHWTDAWILRGSCSGRIALDASEETEETSDAAIVVYPNPASGNSPHVVEFRFAEDAGDVTLDLHNLNGASMLLKEFKGVKRSLSLQVPALPTGLYIFRVQQAKRKVNIKYLIK